MSTMTMNELKDSVISLCRPKVAPIEIVEETFSKTNRGPLTALLFKKPGVAGCPTVYAEDLFDAYNAGMSVESIADNVCMMIMQAYSIAPAVGNMDLDFHEDGRNMSVRLLEKETNEEILTEMPYLEVGGGLVLTADIVSGCGRAVIKNAAFESFNVTKEKLFEAALRGAEKNFPPKLQPISAALKGEDVNLLRGLPSLSLFDDFYVLTNSENFYGASALFYPGVAKKLHKLMGDSLYVIPSSVHELLLIRKNGAIPPEDFVQMIGEANSTVVSKDEYLSNDLLMLTNGNLSKVSYGGFIPNGIAVSPIS